MFMKGAVGAMTVRGRTAADSGSSFTKPLLPPHTFTFTQWRTQEFFRGGGVQQIHLWTEDRQNGDLEAVAS